MALDEADKKAIADQIAAAFSPDAIAKVLAPVVEAHVKAATKDLPTAEGIGKSIAAEVAKLKPAEDPPKDDKKDKPDAALTAKIDELQKSVKAAETARLEAEQARKVDAGRSAARDALAKAGVPAEKLHLVMPVIEASGVLDLAGDKPGWKGKNSYGADDVLTLEEGAAAWVKTDDGKHFLPPVDAGGTGQGNNGRKVAGPGPSEVRGADGTLDPNRLLGKILAATPA